MAARSRGGGADAHPQAGVPSLLIAAQGRSSAFFTTIASLGELCERTASCATATTSTACCWTAPPPRAALRVHDGRAPLRAVGESAPGSAARHAAIARRDVRPSHRAAATLRPNESTAVERHKLKSHSPIRCHLITSCNHG
jgi:hypothetical protein